MKLLHAVQNLGDSELLAKGDALVLHERRAQAILLAIIGEIDRRRLYLKYAHPHMFALCVERWGYSRDAAYRRLHAARACRKHPEALSMIDDGSIQLSGLAALEPFLGNHGGLALLDRAKGMGRRDVEKLVAEAAPRPDIADTMRAAPAALLTSSPPPSGGAVPMEIALRPPDRVAASAPERVQFSFTGSEELRTVLLRIRSLLWHRFPFGRLEDLVLEAAQDYLNRHDPQRKLKLSEPRPARVEETRRIPQWVRDRVWARDCGRCAFTSEDGRRCGETAGLELDHIKPWGQGGSSDDPKNVRLLCRAHNQQAARESYGG